MLNNTLRDQIVMKAIIGEPEVVEDAWYDLKKAVSQLRDLQQRDGAVRQPDENDDSAQAQHDYADRIRQAHELVATITAKIEDLAPHFAHDHDYLQAVVADFHRWSASGFGAPDFYDSLMAFQPQQQRVDGLRHLVVFPMYTQNGSPDKRVEALIVETIWPDFIAELEAGHYSNPLFVSLRLIDFTAGYDTNSAVLFPETIATAEVPPFTWGAIFQDREAARYRRVVRAAAEITRLQLPARAAAMLDNQAQTEKTFVMWDIIHDRTHMRGDLPFDPFMIRQRMPYFLYSLEELRCDLTAFRECVAIERALRRRRDSGEQLTASEQEMLDQAGLVQFAVVCDRIFRFAVTGSRVRNYDGLGGQLLFAWLHQKGVVHWTDTQLTIDWDALPPCVIALGDAIDDLYWRSIDRPKAAHWLAAYDLVRSVLTPHPASQWNRGLPDTVLAGPLKGYTDAVLDDEFPLSMFYEALQKKIGPVIESTVGIRASDA